MNIINLIYRSHFHQQLIPYLFSLNFTRLLRVVVTPSVRGENDSKQSDEFQANPWEGWLSLLSYPIICDVILLVETMKILQTYMHNIRFE